jgi:hypothetical protein
LLDGGVVNEVVLKGANYGCASRMLVLEDFDMLFRNIEGTPEEVIDAIGVFDATLEPLRYAFCVLLVLVDAYQQSEDGTSGSACQFRRWIKADVIVRETWVP